MKSRTLCCKGTVLRKDIARFAPLWAIYLIGGLLVMMSMIASGSEDSAARSLASTIGPFSVINMIYAALCAQMLFGDLFKSRMCNALHAMPLRRESWFLTHVTAGMLFSLVPHVIAVVLMSLILEEFWFVALYWLLGMTLEYLFFFGLAVFSVFCAGNRFAQVAVYGIINFASMIVAWFVDTIYEPLLYGVDLPDAVYVPFCPVVQMCTSTVLLRFERIQTNIHYYENQIWEYKGLGEGWDYLILCAVLGVVLLVAALLLYRRRKLECAGNFIAVKPLEPVFQVVFTLCAGGVVSAFGEIFDGGYIVYLVVGLVVGWFVAQMLLRRTVKVFQWKTFLLLAVFGVVMGGSLLLTQMDLLGVTRWVPKAEQVAVVEVNAGSQISTHSSNYLKMENSEQIQTVINAHDTIIQEGAVSRNNAPYRTFTIRYTMKDGRQVSRTYQLYSGTQAWKAMERLYSAPERIMGYTDWDSFVENVSVRIEGDSLENLCQTYQRKFGKQVDHEAIKLELLEAIRKDCEAGWVTSNLFDKDMGDYKFTVELEQDSLWRYITATTSSKNMLAWYDAYRDIVSMSAK